jgi:hypothetical protein
MSEENKGAYERNEVSLWDPASCLGALIGLVIFFVALAIWAGVVG